MNLTATAAGHSPSGSARVTLQRSWVKATLALSLGAGCALSIVLVVLQFAEKQPGETFALLKSWGPWCLIVVLCLVLLSRLLSEGIQGGLTIFRESTAAQVASAEAQSRTADALTRLADQNGKQAEEVRRLSIYAAREFPNMYDRFDKQDVVLNQIAGSIKDFHARFESISRTGE